MLWKCSTRQSFIFPKWHSFKIGTLRSIATLVSIQLKSFWHYLVCVKSTLKISSIFVGFLENTNFTVLIIRAKMAKSIEYLATIVFGINVSAIWKGITDICAQNDCFSALSFSNNKKIFFYAKSNIWCRQTSLWISKVITE